ncbi:glutathione S-transferase C-terminal-like protein [Irpex rosettiformis]|uniref:Glutathione S-transferase C-terminal-like protein n=1 Tax=Irpex rosettiformis TaxID=378272 RepID=A0ACB8U4I4_9APHY|nr:glutathione S-transferase C-terminal-like protein [Irpex rosettiformis]
MTTKQLTLYTARICPYAQRTEIALAEAKAKFTRYEIDLQNKPEWYAPKVNPASKVPAIAYGGPEVPPDQPSPESVKLNESLVLVEFIADLYPESGILPKDPVLRAKARLFIDAVSTKYSPAAFKATHSGDGDPEAFVQALESLQALLPPKGFVVGEFSIADIAIAPFLARLEVTLSNDLGPWPANSGEGQKLLKTLQQPKLARLWEYSKEVQSRPSFIATFDKDVIIKGAERRFKAFREQKYGA